MPAVTFYWHDYETFGRWPRRDRPAQFAGVRTDAELHEIGTPANWLCRPAPDTLPDPDSVLLTGITPQQALARGLREHAFAARIEAELGAPGTIGVGYNSLRFDDEVTRHLFWRSLIDPYAREWQNGCSRWDVLDVVRAAWALRPDGIAWPRHDDGRPSFRLQDLAAANGLVHEAAHDALSDVRATIALARLLKARQPRLWHYCLKLRDKAAVRDAIGVDRPFLHLSGMYGQDRGCMALVWPLAAHPTNRNEIIVWDLAHDPAELARLTVDEARLRLFTRADALPPGTPRLPVKTLHVNRSPIVVANLAALDAAGRARWNIDVDQGLRHAETVRVFARTLDALWAEVYARPQREPADVDEDLYAGLPGDDDRRRLDRLRVLPPDALADRRPGFDDERLEELLFRYRARNFPETLGDDDTARWRAHCADRLLRGSGGALTRAGYDARIDELLAAGPGDRDRALLQALRAHGQRIAPA